MKCAAAITTAGRRARTRTDSKQYRCFYSPLDREGWPIYNESGHLPFIDLKAASNEDAHHKAFAAKQCPIAHVERLERAS